MNKQSIAEMDGKPGEEIAFMVDGVVYSPRQLEDVRLAAMPADWRKFERRLREVVVRWTWKKETAFGFDWLHKDNRRVFNKQGKEISAVFAIR